MIEITTHSEAKTRSIAQRLARRLRSGDVIALEGPLGAGKTCFVRGLAEGLGLDAQAVSSPTFVICQEYDATEGDSCRGLTLVHIDAYRLSSPEELDAVGWDELLRTKDTVIAVEWPERLGDSLPPDHVRVRLSHLDATSRVIALEASLSMHDRLTIDGTEDASGDAPSHCCPICGKQTSVVADTFPFCSVRCRLVDLGKWFREGYRISQPIGQTDTD